MSTKHYLSFDIEDWFHVPFLQGYLSKEEWPRQVSIVESGTRKILLLLNQYKLQATFFVLGLVAETNPGLVKEIAAAGHEIGIHGYAHIPLDHTDRESFRIDIARAIALVKDITGQQPIGYRAPLCSVSESSLWALEILREQNILYDSSIYPANPLVYSGIQRVSQQPHEVIPGFWEVPLSSGKYLGLPIPISGGFYLRALPFWLFQHMLNKLNSRGEGVVLYYHPWEFATHYPRPITNPAKSFIQYHNLKSVRPKLEELLQIYNFAPLRDALPNQSKAMR